MNWSNLASNIRFMIVFLCDLFFPVSCRVGADENQTFGTENMPPKGSAQSIGYYTKNYLARAVTLPVDGPDWQVMRLARNRNYPALVRGLRDVVAKAKAVGWSDFLWATLLNHAETIWSIVMQRIKSVPMPIFGLLRCQTTGFEQPKRGFKGHNHAKTALSLC